MTVTTENYTTISDGDSRSDRDNVVEVRSNDQNFEDGTGDRRDVVDEETGDNQGDHQVEDHNPITDSLEITVSSSDDDSVFSEIDTDESLSDHDVEDDDQRDQRDLGVVIPVNIGHPSTANDSDTISFVTLDGDDSYDGFESSDSPHHHAGLDRPKERRGSVTSNNLDHAIFPWLPQVFEEICLLTERPAYRPLGEIVHLLCNDVLSAGEDDRPTPTIAELEVVDRQVDDCSDLQGDHKERVRRLLCIVVDQTKPDYDLYRTLHYVIGYLGCAVIRDSDPCVRSFHHNYLIDQVAQAYGYDFTTTSVALALTHHLCRVERVDYRRNITLPDTFCLLMEELTPTHLDRVPLSVWHFWFPLPTKRYIRITLALLKAIRIDSSNRNLDEEIFDQWVQRELIDFSHSLRFLEHPFIVTMLTIVHWKLQFET